MFVLDEPKKGDGPSEPSPYKVRETRVELARHRWHYLLRVARLPISPPALRMECKVTQFFHILKNCVNFSTNTSEDMPTEYVRTRCQRRSCAPTVPQQC